MTKIKQLKIAFQGGGAKLVTLLECASYLQELHKENKIQILAVSGTSAGAIVAGLLALDADFEKIKQHLLDKKKGYLKKFQISNFAASLLKVIAGKSIIDQKHLEDSIEKLFRVGTGKSSQEFENSPIPLNIVVADLLSGGKHTFTREDTGKEKIVESIVHSCAIPILFRIHKQNQKYADGGICENLPVEELTIEKGVYNVAIGFENEEADTFARFSGIKQYVGKVIAAAIDHNVTRSESSDVCDIVIKLPNNVSTTEFEKAFDELESKSHRSLVRAEVDRNINRLDSLTREREQLIQVQRLRTFRIEKQFENAQLALKQLEHNKVRFLERGIAITPYCLEDTHFMQRDRITQFYRLVPEETLHGIHIQLATPTVGTVEKFYTIVVKDIKAKQIVESVPIELNRDRATDMGNKAVDVFIHCKGGLKPEREYHIVADYGLPNAFSNLKVCGEDYLVVHNSNELDVTYEKVTMIFFCPPCYKNKVKMRHYVDLQDKKEGYTIVEGALNSDQNEAFDYIDAYRTEGDFEPYIWTYNGGMRYKQSTGVLVFASD